MVWKVLGGERLKLSPQDLLTSADIDAEGFELQHFDLALDLLALTLDIGQHPRFGAIPRAGEVEAKGLAVEGTASLKAAIGGPGIGENGGAIEHGNPLNLAIPYELI